VLDQIADRVLWLAVRMIDAANRERETGDGVPVGGHPASCASLVPAMTALYFAHLDRADRVSVKPHAAPVFHAIQYLLGRLDRRYLTRLRARGGLQAYPSRTRDPDRVDFSTGSLGLGPVASLFAAVTRRYVDEHFGPREPSRFVALLGDAELDEGSVWEAVTDHASIGLGNVLWIVDCNRQSLDRVVPVARDRLRAALFASAGWHVREVRYGRRLQERFAQPSGRALRSWLDAVPDDEYRTLFGREGADLRARIRECAPADVERALAEVPDDDLPALVFDFGGHDIGALLDAYAECDAVTDRPSVVFAHTVKGWGLPVAWSPGNHYAQLTGEEIDRLRASRGLTPHDEWDRFPDGSATARWCRVRAEHLTRPPVPGPPTVPVPVQVRGAEDAVVARPVSTQEGFGVLLRGLAGRPELAPYLVTAAPDVATATGLSGFIDRSGSYRAARPRDRHEADTTPQWRCSPRGQHIELGVSEMNLFSLLAQLGLAWDLSGRPLLPVGTVYDPFLCRGLDALVYAAHSGARFLIVGTPSGISLAPEGSQHQSTITPSIGMALPGMTYCEPAYLGALEWLLCDALGRIARGEDRASSYLRLSSRPLDQAPFEAARARYGDQELRRFVLAGGYRLIDSGSGDAPEVHLVGCGAVLPEVVAAAGLLAERGVAAHVVDVTSPDRLYRAWHEPLRHAARTAWTPRRPALFDTLFPGRAPVVTVHDASSHALAWLGSALGTPAVPLGVDAAGQSGSVRELYDLHGLLPPSIADAALAALAMARDARGRSTTHGRPLR
jgi:pyruvate dehydrogenase E1 component